MPTQLQINTRAQKIHSILEPGNVFTLAKVIAELQLKVEALQQSKGVSDSHAFENYWDVEGYTLAHSDKNELTKYREFFEAGRESMSNKKHPSISERVPPSKMKNKKRV